MPAPDPPATILEPSDGPLILGISIPVGILMSTQFLAQPFVWRNWDLKDVLFGWMQIAVDRLTVALSIATGVLVIVRLTPGASRAQRVLLPLAIACGSVVGELGRSLIDPNGDHTDYWSLLGRILQWSAVTGAILAISLSWRSVSAATLAADEAELVRAQMRRITTLAHLENLQRQIEPHFLFNTLATIRRLGTTAPSQGRQLLARLFDFIAANLDGDGVEFSTLGVELDLAGAYLDVCSARMGSRLLVTWSVQARFRHHAFPKYVVGTLVENAIKHGISPNPGGGHIGVGVSADSRNLILTIDNSGHGIADLGGTGTGLANLIARLRLTHGDRADFSLQDFPNGDVRAIVQIPLERAFEDA